MIKKEEYIKRKLEVLKKQLEKVLPDEAFFSEMEDLVNTFLKEKIKG
jgi:hypothetical protein